MNLCRTFSPLSARLLAGILSRGGEASLPQLASIGWGLDDFHPLRDSKRIHVAIRRLRTRLEADASDPTRLVTTTDGYRVGPDAPAGTWERPSDTAVSSSRR